jgi:hypothetical protein
MALFSSWGLPAGGWEFDFFLPQVATAADKLKIIAIFAIADDVIMNTPRFT